MKNKKLLLVVLSALLVLSLSLFAACGGGDDSSSSPADSSSAPIVDSSTPEQSGPADSSEPSVDTREVVSIAYESGLDEQYYLKNTDLDLSNLKITVNYKDGTSEILSYNSAFEVSYDSEVQEYGAYRTVTITYGGKTCEKQIIFYSQYKVADNGVSRPGYYLNYITQIQADAPIFTDLSASYKVGDDNALSVRPTVRGINNFTNVESGDIKNIPMVVSIEKWDTDAYVLMDNPGTDVDVDVEAVTVDFADSAIGNKYRISVYPNMLTSAQMENLSAYTSVIEVEVVDGYNVTNVLELSLYDNAKTDGGKAWKALREEAGITADASAIHGIVLHENLAISASDIPSYFLYKEGDSDVNASDADYDRVIGSLRDYEYIFTRMTQKGDHFDLHGNYFNVDAGALPIIVRENGEVMADDKVVVSHSALFRIECEGTKEDCNETLASINNVNFLGNLKLENTSYTGGIILIKVDTQNMVLNNITARQWYITAFAQLTDNETCALKIKNNQYYDNYNSFVYSWGAYVNIENSIMKTCGGPVIIADNCYAKETESNPNHPRGFIPQINVDDASVLESWVAGTESWFVQMNAASTAEALKSLNGLFQLQGGRTFVSEKDGANKLNLVAVIKSGDAQAMTFVPIAGRMNIGNLAFDMDNPIVVGIAGQSVLFQGGLDETIPGGGLLAMAPDSTLCDAYSLVANVQSGGLAPIQTAAKGHVGFSGDYLGIYVGSAFAQSADGGYLGVILGGYKNM